MPGADDLGTRRFVGARVRHVEDPKFLTGQASYTDDFKLSGTVHAAFVRSTHAHARIIAIDATAARAQPGVLAVLTARDIEQDVEPIRAPCSYPTYQETPQDLLAREKVRLAGEPVAVVVAENRYLAEDAAEMVSASYEQLTPVTSMEQALADGAPAVHDTAPDNLHVWFHRVS